MADIDRELNQIKNAVYGKEVRGSIHDGIDKINKESECSRQIADNTEQRQDAVDQQFNDVLKGWSDDRPIDNAETIASRTNTNTSENYDTLGQRLDAENKKITSLLAETEEEIDQHRSYVNDKFSRVNDNLQLKRDQSKKIELHDASEEFLSAMRGDANFTILSEPRPNSVTRETYDKAILSANLFDKDKVNQGWYVNGNNGNGEASSSRNTSDYVLIHPDVTYTAKKASSYHYYDSDKNFISGANTPPNEYNIPQTFTAPPNAMYLRISYYNTNNRNYGISDREQMVVEGTELPNTYIPHTFRLKDLRLSEENLEGIDVELSDNKEGKILVPRSMSWQDVTFVGNHFWAFSNSDGTSGVGKIRMFEIPIPGESLSLIKELEHNFGHCNTVDYREQTDSLIFGNGSGQYDTDGEVYIIMGVKHWINLPDNTFLDIDDLPNGSTLVEIKVGRDFGDKVNVCWGEENYFRYNICYVLSNDNKNIRKLMLGLGEYELDHGQFINGKSEDEFNGTYKILSEHFMDEVIQVNQGTCYYNGYIYSAIGHHGLYIARFKLNADGSISTELKQERAYDDEGNVLSSASSGVAIRDGFIYHTALGDARAIRKYRVF